MKDITRFTPYIVVSCLFILLTQSGCAVVSNQKDSELSFLKSNVSTEMDLGGKSLKEVPSEIYDMHRLRELDLSNNELEGSLRAEIKNLEQLRVLDLSHNRFTNLPAEIGQLQNLEVLDLSENNFTGLPREIGNLSKLQVLDVSGNSYSEVDMQVIEAQLPKSTRVVK